MIKVAFVLENFPKQSETFVLNQIKDFIDSGADVRIIACYPSSDSLDLNDTFLLNKVTYLSSVNNMLTRNLRQLAVLKPAILQELIFHNFYRIQSKLGGFSDFDFIIAHFGPQGVLALRLREMGIIKGKILTFFHGYELSRLRILNLYKSAYRNLFHETEMILAVSEFWRKKLLSLGCPKNVAITQHMGVDTDYYSYNPKITSGSPLSIISVARLTEKKGLHLAIRAVAGLSRIVNLEYVIIGAGSLQPKLEALIKELNAESYIKLAGLKTQDLTRQYLRQADLMLLPSLTAENGDMEGIPVTLMEAMACGVPVITTEHSGIPELVDDNISGFLVPEKNSQAIQEKIQAFLSMSITERRSIQDSARQVIEKNFCRKILHQKLLMLLNRNLL